MGPRSAEVRGEIPGIGQVPRPHGGETARLRLEQVGGELPRDPARGEDTPVQFLGHVGIHGRKTPKAKSQKTWNPIFEF
jgi:hypothetical protein